MSTLGAGVCIFVLALLGYGVEHVRWGGSPEVHILEIVFLCTVPVGTIVTIIGLIQELSGQ